MTEQEGFETEVEGRWVWLAVTIPLLMGLISTVGILVFA